MTEALKIIHLMAMGQGILIALLLALNKRGHKAANLCLAAFISLLLVMLWNGYVVLLPAEFRHWHIDHVELIVTWLWGPLLLLYVVQLSSGQTVARASYLKHLLPTLFVALVTYTLNRSAYFSPLSAFLIVLIPLYIQLLTYLVACVRHLRHYARMIQQNFSSVEQINLRWLQRLCAGFAALIVVDAVLFLGRIVWPLFPDWSFRALPLAESIYVFVIGLYALRQPEILYSAFAVKEQTKYIHSSLNHHHAERLLQRLDELMENEEPYLDNQLTLGRLADMLSVSPHHLSQALNEHRQQNFYDFINRARIERAKQLLSSSMHQHLSVLDIAFEVGFNNKTSFNKAFKKHTEQTPSAFRRLRAA